MLRRFCTGLKIGNYITHCGIVGITYVGTSEFKRKQDLRVLRIYKVFLYQMVISKITDRWAIVCVFHK